MGSPPQSETSAADNGSRCVTSHGTIACAYRNSACSSASRGDMLLLNDQGCTNTNTATLTAMMTQLTTGFVRVGLTSLIGNIRPVAYDARGGNDDTASFRHGYHSARLQ